MEHHKAQVREIAGHGGVPGAGHGGVLRDDTARFLHELRQLRNGAGLGHAELAALAHYPYDCIRAAEAGPTLPDLPVLAAFVRGCGGTTEEWEERWRSLTRTPALSSLPVREAGCSAAASAGARIGATTPAVETPHPSVIMAALDRVAEEMATADGGISPAGGVAGVSGVPAGGPAPVAGGVPGGSVTPAVGDVAGVAGGSGTPAAGVTSAVSGYPAAGRTSPTAGGAASAEGLAWAAAMAAGSAAPDAAAAGPTATPLSAAVPGQRGTSAYEGLSPSAPAAVGGPGAAGAPGTSGQVPGRLPLPPRALAAALIAIAVCVVVALLAIALTRRPGSGVRRAGSSRLR